MVCNLVDFLLKYLYLTLYNYCVLFQLRWHPFEIPPKAKGKVDFLEVSVPSFIIA